MFVLVFILIEDSSTLATIDVEIAICVGRENSNIKFVGSRLQPIEWHAELQILLPLS